MSEDLNQIYCGRSLDMNIRRYERIIHPCKENPDGSSIWLGENERISFQMNGYAGSIVGPGPKGVGDKEGGYSEKSTGFNES